MRLTIGLLAHSYKLLKKGSGAAVTPRSENAAIRKIERSLSLPSLREDDVSPRTAVSTSSKQQNAPKAGNGESSCRAVSYSRSDQVEWERGVDSVMKLLWRDWIKQEKEIRQHYRKKSKMTPRHSRSGGLLSSSCSADESETTKGSQLSTASRHNRKGVKLLSFLETSAIEDPSATNLIRVLSVIHQMIIEGPPNVHRLPSVMPTLHFLHSLAERRGGELAEPAAQTCVAKHASHNCEPTVDDLAERALVSQLLEEELQLTKGVNQPSVQDHERNQFNIAAEYGAMCRHKIQLLKSLDSFFTADWSLEMCVCGVQLQEPTQFFSSDTYSGGPSTCKQVIHRWKYLLFQMLSDISRCPTVSVSVSSDFALLANPHACTTSDSVASSVDEPRRVTEAVTHPFSFSTLSLLLDYGMVASLLCGRILNMVSSCAHDPDARRRVMAQTGTLRRALMLECRFLLRALTLSLACVTLRVLLPQVDDWGLATVVAEDGVLPPSHTNRELYEALRVTLQRGCNELIDIIGQRLSNNSEGPMEGGCCLQFLTLGGDGNLLRLIVQSLTNEVADFYFRTPTDPARENSQLNDVELFKVPVPVRIESTLLATKKSEMIRKVLGCKSKVFTFYDNLNRLVELVEEQEEDDVVDSDLSSLCELYMSGVECSVFGSGTRENSSSRLLWKHSSSLRDRQQQTYEMFKVVHMKTSQTEKERKTSSSSSSTSQKSHLDPIQMKVSDCSLLPRLWMSKTSAKYWLKWFDNRVHPHRPEGGEHSSGNAVPCSVIPPFTLPPRHYYGQLFFCLRQMLLLGTNARLRRLDGIAIRASRKLHQRSSSMQNFHTCDITSNNSINKMSASSSPMMMMVASPSDTSRNNVMLSDIFTPSSSPPQTTNDNTHSSVINRSPIAKDTQSAAVVIRRSLSAMADTAVVNQQSLSLPQKPTIFQQQQPHSPSITPSHWNIRGLEGDASAPLTPNSTVSGRDDDTGGNVPPFWNSHKVNASLTPTDKYRQRTMNNDNTTVTVSPLAVLHQRQQSIQRITSDISSNDLTNAGVLTSCRVAQTTTADKAPKPDRRPSFFHNDPIHFREIPDSRSSRVIKPLVVVPVDGGQTQSPVRTQKRSKTSGEINVKQHAYAAVHNQSYVEPPVCMPDTPRHTRKVNNKKSQRGSPVNVSGHNHDLPVVVASFERGRIATRQDFGVRTASPMVMMSSRQPSTQGRPVEYVRTHSFTANNNNVSPKRIRSCRPMAYTETQPTKFISPIGGNTQSAYSLHFADSRKLIPMTDGHLPVGNTHRQNATPVKQYNNTGYPVAVLSNGASPQMIGYTTFVRSPSPMNFFDNNGRRTPLSISITAENPTVADFARGGGVPPNKLTSPAALTERTLANFNFESNELVIGAKIGQGASGEVHKGVWRGTEVAIKSLKLLCKDEKPSTFKKKLEEIRSEIDIMVRIRHPNLILVMGATTSSNGSVYLITEYCSGGSLFDVLHSQSDYYKQHIARKNLPARQSNYQLTWAQRIKIALDIAKGCAYLHGSRPPILHRDLKSLNILLSESLANENQVPHAKVTDFGVSLLRASILGTNSNGRQFRGRESSFCVGLAGTYHWMAPEMIQGRPYDESVDAYSYGILLYEIVTSTIPYADTQVKSPIEIARMVAHKGLRPDLSKIPPDCPESLCTLIRQCWDARPEVRPKFIQIVQKLNAISSNALN